MKNVWMLFWNTILKGVKDETVCYEVCIEIVKDHEGNVNISVLNEKPRSFNSSPPGIITVNYIV